MKKTAQNCHVARQYSTTCNHTNNEKLCEPESYFDMIEKCKNCNKTL